LSLNSPLLGLLHISLKTRSHPLGLERDASRSAESSTPESIVVTMPLGDSLSDSSSADGDRLMPSRLIHSGSIRDPIFHSSTLGMRRSRRHLRAPCSAFLV